MTSYDLIFRNGTLIDGGGEPRRAADVAIKGDRIVAIGAPGTLRGDNEIDVAGKVVAPGFIDVHTHDDTALIENPSMAMKASQGVTTVVCGNCGFSPAPYSGPKPAPHNLSLIVKQERFLTQSFAAFAELVEAARPAINGAFLIGHATLRYSVLGADLERAATGAETTRMRDMLDNALGDGAIGMSSGLFYPPAAHATTDEVAEVAATFVAVTLAEFELVAVNAFVRPNSPNRSTAARTRSAAEDRLVTSNFRCTASFC